MAGSGAGNEGDVDGDAVPRQLSGCVDGDVVDAATWPSVLKGVMSTPMRMNS